VGKAFPEKSGKTWTHAVPQVPPPMSLRNT